VIGKEFLALAFKWAREADPTAELYYNDYNLDASDAKRATTIELVKYLREQGAPIDGIGMQGHYNLNRPSTAKIDETIRMFSELGVKIVVTELDVAVNRDANAAVTGAVGSSPDGAAPARGAFPGQGARGPAAGGPPGGRGPGGGFPTIDVLKTTVNLTPEQVAAITPILETYAKDRDAAAGDFPKLQEVRTAAVTAIRGKLTEPQQASFATLVAPAGRGRGQPTVPLTAAEQQALAKRYGEIFEVFLKHRQSITRVTLWGLRDTDSWRRTSSPVLFDENYARKPAYDAVIAVAAKAAK